MKRLLFAALLLLVTGCTVERVAAYDFEQAWRYLYTAATAENRLLRAENRILKPLAETAPVLIVRNEELEVELAQVREELAEASRIANMVTSVSSLESQITRLKSSLGTAIYRLGEEQSELGRVLSAVARIDTAIGQFGCRRFYGKSMVPTFDEFDLVCIQKAPFSVSVRDIVIAPCPPAGFNVIHRVVGGDASGYVLKGDAKKSPDPCRPALSDIMWKVVAIAKNVYW